VPFFLKQWGIWENNPTPPQQELDPDAKGGATLDGRLWREFPSPLIVAENSPWSRLSIRRSATIVTPTLTARTGR
jgi:hypothetical protein